MKQHAGSGENIDGSTVERSVANSLSCLRADSTVAW